MSKPMKRTEKLEINMFESWDDEAERPRFSPVRNHLTAEDEQRVIDKLNELVNAVNRLTDVTKTDD